MKKYLEVLANLEAAIKDDEIRSVALSSGRFQIHGRPCRYLRHERLNMARKPDPINVIETILPSGEGNQIASGWLRVTELLFMAAARENAPNAMAKDEDCSHILLKQNTA